MKKILLFFSLLLCTHFTLSGQTFQDIKVLPTSTTNNDAYVELQTYLLEKYPEKIDGITYDIDAQFMILTTLLQPIDVLQILRKLGQESVYFISEAERYILSPDALKLKISK